MNQPKAIVRTDEEAVQRHIPGIIGWAIAGIAIVFALFQLYQMGIGLMPAQNLRAVHLAFTLGLIFLLYPTVKSWDMSRFSIFDAMLAAAAITGPLYFYIYFNDMVMRAGAETSLDLFMGLVTIVALLEATRRAIGPVLPAIAIAFMAYAYFGSSMPDLIAHRGYSPERIIRHLYPTTEGVFGIPLAVASTFVFLFVLFGAVMQRTGISDYLTRVAMSGLGHYRGGPAKSAVLASAMMGSFSGSSTANVATTGTLTIPLMKRVGFRPQSAGGIETAASASGQFIPPVMGAAVFVMVEITGIAYVDIIRAALLPAVLDIFGILFCVHMHALKMKIDGLPRRELPPFWATLLSQIYLVIPIVGLILMLTVLRYTPTMSAFWAIPIALLISLVARNTIIVWRATRAQLRGEDPFEGVEEALDRQRSEQAAAREIRSGEIRSYGTLFGKAWGDWFKDIVKALEDGARQAIPISAACATAGIIIGIITLTGLGLRMQSILLTLSGGELWAALIFTALGSIILGLGVPTTANYIIMATLMAPALVQLEVPLLAAHLFVFYFGILADVTPPVGLGAYVAAGIARADPIKTAFEGFKFSITAFIIPFMFVYNPQLLLIGEWTWGEVAWLFASAAIGTYALAVMKEGWWITRANVIERITMTIAALLLITPSLGLDLAGFALMGVIYGVQMVKVRREAARGYSEPTRAARLVTAAGVIALPVALAWMFLPVVQVAGDEGTVSRTAFPGQTVILSHIHSVEQTRVEDHFRLGWRGDLIHARTVTRSMGAGLPEGGAARGGVMTTRGTGERMRELPLRFGPQNEPLLTVAGTQEDLSSFADGSAVALRTMFVWERLFPGLR